MMAHAKRNTNTVLWSEDAAWSAPLLFVTDGGGIGIDVGGNVVVMPIRKWHALALKELGSVAEPHPAADPRDPDYTRAGIFADHNCWKCSDGTKACANGDPAGCEFPRARND